MFPPPAGGGPPALRIRQAWENLSPQQRVNRVLYGLALASMLGLLLELGLGDRSPDLDVASEPASTTPRQPSTTVPAPPSTAATLGAETAGPAVNLADIVAQVTGAANEEAGSASAGRTTGGGTPARTGAQPSGGGARGAPSPAGDGSSPAPGPAAQPEQTAGPAPDPDPVVTSPTTASTTVTTRPQTTVTFDVPTFTVPDRTGTTTRRNTR